MDRDGGNAFQADATNTPHVDGLDVTHCDRRDYRKSAAANNLSRRTGHSSPAENNRIFLKIRLCDGPPLARWASPLLHRTGRCPTAQCCCRSGPSGGFPECRLSNRLIRPAAGRSTSFPAGLLYPAHPLRPAGDVPSPALEPGCAARIDGLCRSPSPGMPARLPKLPSDDSRHGSRTNSTAAKGGQDRKEQSHPFSRQILLRGACRP